MYLPVAHDLARAEPGKAEQEDVGQDATEAPHGFVESRINFFGSQKSRQRVVEEAFYLQICATDSGKRTDRV